MTVCKSRFRRFRFVQSWGLVYGTHFFILILSHFLCLSTQLHYTAVKVMSEFSLNELVSFENRYLKQGGKEVLAASHKGNIYLEWVASVFFIYFSFCLLGGAPIRETFHRAVCNLTLNTNQHWEDDGWPAIAAQARSDVSLDRTGSIRLPFRPPSPPTLLSTEGDTSNLASCSLGTLINKRAPDSFEIILFSGGFFQQISPPLYLL